MIDSATLKVVINNIPAEAVGKEVWDSLYAHALEWEILEKQCSKLFVVGDVVNHGRLLIESPNQALANLFVKEFAAAYPSCSIAEPTEPMK